MSLIMKLKKILAGTVLSAFAATSHAIVVTGETGATALASEVAGPGINIFNESFTGGSTAAGTFTDGFSSGLGLNSGVILSSGNVADIAGPNTSPNTTTNFGLAGSPELSGLSGNTTFDAAILSFDFQFASGTSSDLSLNFVFGSEEYNEYVGSQFNDVFAVFLDGVNVATLDDGSAVAINTVNNGSNSSLFNDNTAGAFDTEMDGFTSLLSYDFFNLDNAVHNISFQVADASDLILDSWLLLGADSVTTINPVNTVPELSASAAPISAALLIAILGLGVERRRKAKK